MRIEVTSEADTIALAERLAAVLRGGELIVLEGDLGAGKTFFSRALARALGVPPTIAVTSPTFALVHEYPEATPPLLHADLYRLGSVDELEDLGLSERVGTEWTLVVEWGERFVDALGDPSLLLRFSFGEGEGRVLDASGALAARVVV